MDAEVQHDFVHDHATVGGVRLHWVETGRGDPVLLLPGWPQSWYAWRKVMPLLAARDRRVIVLDPRGLGGSDKPDVGYDLDTLVDDVRGFMAQTGLLRPGGIDIVSHDVGSWIAYALASAHSECVRRLVVSEMTILEVGAVRPIPDERANIGSWHFGFNRLRGLPEALVAGRERLFLDWLFDNKAANPEAIDEAAREHYAASFAAPGAAKAGFEYYRALLAPEGLRRTAERLETPLAMPVLAIGARGGVGSRLAKSLGDAVGELHSIVLEAGHYLAEEAPAAFVDAVTAFWDRTAG